MKPKTIAVIGTKKTGKTTTIENLTRELTKRGYKVAAIKHINEPNFTIDTPGKDTWKYAQAGAKTIITIADNETATIQKTPTENITLNTLLKKCTGNDIVLIEGLKKHTATNKNIPKIVTTKTTEQATHALQKYTPILAFSGPNPTNTLNRKIPYIDATKNPQQLATLIENKLQLKK
ncbi:MAG: molybdopterin-guanine dinucleotide biosynthesis protein B [Candidatus Bathyarchaeota archaeon]|nr:molybdopterin-guanine dinucleotide biosynthesis protein B [Candidatus Bathyarchaeota archaeon]